LASKPQNFFVINGLLLTERPNTLSPCQIFAYLMLLPSLALLKSTLPLLLNTSVAGRASFARLRRKS
jgi:hypothetical protein